MFILFIGEIWTSLIKMGKDYYPIFKIWTFFEAHIHICHPDDIEVINFKLKLYEY